MRKPRIKARSAQAVVPRIQNKFDGDVQRPHIDTVKVLFFAQSRDAAGCESAQLELDRPVDSSEFWDRLIEKFAGLAPLRRTTRLARRECYLAADELLQPHDEIAVIPPVSGG